MIFISTRILDTRMRGRSHTSRARRVSPRQLARSLYDLCQCSRQSVARVHAGNAVREGEQRKVILSRLAKVNSASAAPSTRPGFSGSGTVPAHAWLMWRARFRISPTSRPISAAGTSPKTVRCRVAAADVFGCGKNRAKLALAGHFFKRRAGIGDRHEMLARFRLQLL